MNHYCQQLSNLMNLFTEQQRQWASETKRRTKTAAVKNMSSWYNWRAQLAVNNNCIIRQWRYRLNLVLWYTNDLPYIIYKHTHTHTHCAIESETENSTVQLSQRHKTALCNWVRDTKQHCAIESETQNNTAQLSRTQNSTVQLSQRQKTSKETKESKTQRWDWYNYWPTLVTVSWDMPSASRGDIAASSSSRCRCTSSRSATATELSCYHDITDYYHHENCLIMMPLYSELSCICATHTVNVTIIYKHWL